MGECSGVLGVDGMFHPVTTDDVSVFEPREGRVLGDDKNVPEKGADAVSHPSHYTRGGVECIEGIKAALGEGFVDYCQGNVLKYVWRWKLKGGVEDLRKAQVYLGWMIEAAEGKAE